MAKDRQPYKVVILCGGYGRRLNQETEFKPKPLIEIGEHPILWHIMKIYSSYGFKDFILCLGYKGNMIIDYFVNYPTQNTDFTLDLKTQRYKFYEPIRDNDWNITLAHTGLHTMTGGRLKRIQKYIKEDLFLVTYGDGVANINPLELLAYHKKNRKIATITGVHIPATFGVLSINQKGLVNRFSEKPMLKGWINGGFFVFNSKIFDYLKDDKEILEEGPLKLLAKEKKLALYQHDGFWKCMDTQKNVDELNELWTTGNAPWKRWK